MLGRRLPAQPSQAQPRPLALAGSGWLWLALAGSGWLWLALAGAGWHWLALAGSGWLWLALAGTGWLSLALAGSGWLHAVLPHLNALLDEISWNTFLAVANLKQYWDTSLG